MGVIGPTPGIVCRRRVVTSRLASHAIACLRSGCGGSTRRPIAPLGGARASSQGVKIGILNDRSGGYADFGGNWSVKAAKMAIEDFGGSVLDEKIELVSAGHQNKPDLASANARRWYDAEGVDMITDLNNSSVALAVQHIVVGSATPALTGSACAPYGFQWAFNTHALAVVVKTGADSWFFITVDYAFASRAGAGYQRRHHVQRGQGARPRALPAQHL
jgi:ABC-type branched-subunit amino acid transport system substrate-binding protein